MKQKNSAIVYYEVHFTHRPKIHGNFQSNYDSPEGIIANWRDYLTEHYGYPREAIFFVGVFKL